MLNLKVNAKCRYMEMWGACGSGTERVTTNADGSIPPGQLPKAYKYNLIELS